MKHTLLSLALGALLLAPADAGVGDKLPKSDLEIIHPAARTLDAFQGRTILIEFFAHW